MAKSPAHDVATHLNALGLGGFPATGSWPIYVNAEPATPDQTITVYDTGGNGPEDGDQDVIEAPFQIRVRVVNTAAAAAYTKLAAIRTALLAARGYAGDGVVHSFYVMETDVISLGTDENNRHIRVANYRVHRG